MVCSILGLPWFVAATVRSVTHVRSLLQESEVKIPGEKTQIIGARYVEVSVFLGCINNRYVAMGCESPQLGIYFIKIIARSWTETITYLESLFTVQLFGLRRKARDCLAWGIVNGLWVSNSCGFTAQIPRIELPQNKTPECVEKITVLYSISIHSGVLIL